MNVTKRFTYEFTPMRVHEFTRGLRPAQICMKGKLSMKPDKRTIRIII